MKSAAKPQLRDVTDVEKKSTDLKIPGFGECLLVVPLWPVIYIKCLTRITWFRVTLVLQEPFSVLLVLRPKLG